jgi:outer membrane protein TolC
MLRRRHWIAGAAVALLATVCVGSVRAEGLRLEDAITLALQHSERAKVANLQVAVAEAGVDKARAAFLPVVALNANELLRPYHTLKPDGSVSIPYSSGAFSVTLSQPIFNASAFPLYSQSKALLKAQELQSTEDRRQLQFDAARAFLQTLQQQAVLAAAQRRLEFAKVSIDDTQARVAAGLTSANDVTRAELDVATSEREVAADQVTVQRAFVNLEFVLAAKIGNALAAPTALLASAQVKPGSVDSLIASAQGRRLNVAVSKEKLEAARLFAEEPSLRFVPTLGVAAQFKGSSDKGANGLWYDESLTATLTWTLWDAGVRSADSKSREAQASIAELDLSLQRRIVESDIRDASAALEGAQTAFTIAAKVVTAAKKSADETLDLYRTGFARAIELVDANDKLFEAEVSYSTAQYALVQAYLDLRNAEGLDPIGTDGP